MVMVMVMMMLIVIIIIVVVVIIIIGQSGPIRVISPQRPPSNPSPQPVKSAERQKVPINTFPSSSLPMVDNCIFEGLFRAKIRRQ